MAGHSTKVAAGGGGGVQAPHWSSLVTQWGYIRRFPSLASALPLRIRKSPRWLDVNMPLPAIHRPNCCAPSWCCEGDR